MSAQSPPKFTLTAAMILIAATAVGFAGVKAGMGDHYMLSPSYVIKDTSKEFYRFLQWNGVRPRWTTALASATKIVVQAGPVLVAWSLALALIRCWPPRPPLRRLLRQPGAVAELAVIATLALNALLVAVQISLAVLGQSAMTDLHYYANFAFVSSQIIRPDMTAAAVLACWALLGLSGRGRRASGWLDRVGVVLGGLWVALMVFDWIGTRLR